jgi:activating signal cointegrator 1
MNRFEGMPDFLRAVSLWEPWASAMALGIKKNETRGWWTNYRGDLAIHAARRKMTRDDLETFEILVKPSADYEPQYGKILCVVELVAVVPSEVFHEGRVQLEQTEAALGNYEFGRWVWVTQNCRRLATPVPEIGHQSFWVLTEDIAAQVRAQI